MWNEGLQDWEPTTEDPPVVFYTEDFEEMEPPPPPPTTPAPGVQPLPSQESQGSAVQDPMIASLLLPQSSAPQRCPTPTQVLPLAALGFRHLLRVCTRPFGPRLVSRRSLDLHANVLPLAALTCLFLALPSQECLCF